ncbi:outer membrane beta-barrel protein [Devosia sp. Leaf420]|uniref:outer membrane beta-barrel protein n=1 Tax=Devosia sp. Leaf420 TaxID=1736374 RepID=UPI000AFE5324|nr:outer membrane beta-barrel protein [Devosia sp. Leaf420]
MSKRQHNRTIALSVLAGMLASPVFAAPALVVTDEITDTSQSTTTGQTNQTGQTNATTTRRMTDEPEDVTEDRLRPGVYPVQPVPPEFAVANDAPETVPLDWSVGLRGTYTTSNGQETFVTRLTPQFTATHNGGIADLVFSGSAEIAKANGQDAITVTAGGLSLSATAPIDSNTSVKAGANIGLSQDLPGAVGLSPFVITPPQIVTGGIDLGVDRRFGQFNVGITGGIDRVNYGPTTRTDTGVTDNSEQNYWSGNGALRLGYQFTPVLEVFGQGEVQRDIFDVQTASLGVYPNATNRSLRAGIAGKWNTAWSASASVGVGERVFDEASLGAFRAQLYGFEVSYTPDPTVKLTAGLDTTLSPAGADNPGTGRIQYAAFARAQYDINSWLRVRASADWSNSELVGTGTTDRRFALGGGADYVFNKHTSLNADYGYANSDNITSGNTQSHQVSLGVTISR